MAQVTIYLDPETARTLRKAAHSAGVSVSRWIADLVRQKTSDTWPREFLELAGSVPDFPSAEELRRDLPPDLPRERL